jgi:hypothetical protein
MAEHSPAPDLELLAAGVREALTLAGFPANHDDQAARLPGGGFGLYPRGTSLRVAWSSHDDLYDAAWAAEEADPHHALVTWENRIRETMLQAMGEILWSAGFTVAFTPGSDAEGSTSGLMVLAGPRRRPAG